MSRKIKAGVAERSGNLKTGGTFRLIVGLGNVEINGQKIDNQVAADALADAFAQEFGAEEKKNAKSLK